MGKYRKNKKVEINKIKRANGIFSQLALKNH
jgi:hypothetical protein